MNRVGLKQKDCEVVEIVVIFVTLRLIYEYFEIDGLIQIGVMKQISIIF